MGQSNTLGAAEANANEQVEIVIVGGGIIGLVLAAGLLRVGVKVKVYEQAQGFREIGAGIAFTANAIRCMDLINSTVPAALRSGGSVATSSGGEEDDHDPNDYLRWIDGYNRGREGRLQQLFFKLNAGIRGFEGTRRDMFLEALVRTIPEESIELKKKLDTIENRGDDQKILLKFRDGTSVEADAVIGCDGVKSTVRRIMLGADHPSALPRYSHCAAYRTLITMDKAIDALGPYKAMNQHNHIGPGANLLHYPVANNTMINAVAFVRDPNEWTSESTTGQGTKEEVQAVFMGWCAPVTKLVDYFPETMPKWAIFDTFEYPVPHYNDGRICLAGDAAHASSPHHGAGACQGIEDALCLTAVLEQVVSDVRGQPKDKAKALTAAFATYNDVRRTRSQWLVESSRRVCDLHQQTDWADNAKLVKAQGVFEEVKDRSLKIWHFDYDGMIKETLEGYKQRLTPANGITKDKSIY